MALAFSVLGCLISAHFFLAFLTIFKFNIVRSEQFSAVMCSVILVMALSFVPYVDWAAHLGGLIAGFMSGIICFSTWIKTKACAIFWFVIGVGLTVTAYVFIIIYMVTEVEPMNDLNDICGYYQQYFEDYECNCQLNNN